MQIAQELKAAFLFKDWNESDLRNLAAESKTRSLHPGETLFFEGDKSTALYFILRGTVAIKKSAGQNEDEDVGKFGSREVFGEMALLTRDGGTEIRSATAEAVEAVEIVEIPFTALFKQINASPVLGLSFYKNLAISLAGRIRQTTESLAGVRSLRLRHL